MKDKSMSTEQVLELRSGTGETVITGGRVIDPIGAVDEMRDVLIEAGRIVAVDKPGAFASKKSAAVIDAKGKVVAPGLVDIHVHLREPGFEWKEDIETGSKAAVAGGFTTICCMPNTNPAIDSSETAELIVRRAHQVGLCRVHPIGAITVGRKGQQLAPFHELLEAGCVAFSDDGAPVSNAAVMRRALEYCSMFDAILSVHEEVEELSEGFAMNESALSLKLGLRGMPGAAEDIMIARDIELARLTGGRVHFCHVSTARAVTLIKRAKEDGIPVTAETAAHYLLLDETSVGDYDTKAKMSMPLRGAHDVEGLLRGLQDGVIDCVASDHAPHEFDSKNVEFDKASFGILGLQLTLPMLMSLVHSGAISLAKAIELMTSAPTRCFGLPTSSLRAGAHADVVIIDPDREWTVTAESLYSKSKNTPYLGKTLRGMAEKTLMNGRLVFDASAPFFDNVE